MNKADVEALQLQRQNLAFAALQAGFRSAGFTFKDAEVAKEALQQQQHSIMDAADFANEFDAFHNLRCVLYSDTRRDPRWDLRGGSSHARTFSHHQVSATPLDNPRHVRSHILPVASWLPPLNILGLDIPCTGTTMHTCANRCR